ncbi:MAG: hypothetical protein WAN35_19740 [Terracidiphilus sp.]
MIHWLLQSKFCPCVKNILLIVAICISFCVISGCVESSFTLASESRLPKWISLPPGLARADVSVTLNYYINPGRRSAKFILQDRKGKTLAEINGKMKGLYPLNLKNPPQGFDPGYPTYEMITLNDITEIIEHRKPEPIFYVTDDPGIREELLAGRGVK